MWFLSRDSSVQKLVTGWRVRGSNHGVGEFFCTFSRPALGPTQPLVKQLLRVSVPRVKRQGRGVNQSPRSEPRLKKTFYKSNPLSVPSFMLEGDLCLTNRCFMHRTENGSRSGQRL